MPRIFVANNSGEATSPGGLPQSIIVEGEKGLKDRVKKASLTKEEQLKREALLERAFSTSYGLAKLAQALHEPVKRYLDIYPIGRQLLVTEQKNEGEIAYFDLDLEMFPAIVLAKDGNTHLLYLSAERVFVDRLEIGVIVKFPLAEMRWRKYNVLERGKERLKHGLGIKEDLLVFSALNSTVGVMNTEVDAGTSLTPTALATGFESIERHNLIGWGVTMSPHAVADFRSWNNTNIDEVARIEIRQTGYLGQLWGANFFITRLVPVVSSETFVYVTAPPQYTGYMPFWADSEIYASNNLDDFMIGFIGWEMLGISVWNARSVCRVKFDISV